MKHPHDHRSLFVDNAHTLQGSRRSHGSSTVWLLITLLLVQPLALGCTAIDYFMGSNWDARHAKMVPVEDPGILRDGDQVLIVDKNQLGYQGKILEIKRGVSIRIRYYRPDDYYDSLFPTPRWRGVTTLSWDELAKIYAVKVSHRGRTIGVVTGFLIDAGIAFFIWYVNAAGQAAAATGG